MPFELALPPVLRQHATRPVPVRVCMSDGTPVEIVDTLTVARGNHGPLRVVVAVDTVAPHVVTWQILLTNLSGAPIRGIQVTPVAFEFDLDPGELLPRVRHMSGSWHFDACYPPRAFRLYEEAFPTHDHARRLEIGGANAGAHSPILQFGIGDELREALFFGFEWSGGWRISAGWRDRSHHGEPRGPFVIEASMELGRLDLAPGESKLLPRVHLGAASVRSWEQLDNIQRVYLRSLAPAAPYGVRHPVSYDHWFGLYEDFNIDDLLAQASRAAEIGCEVFCLDACWYASDDVLDGLGNWDRPDPRRFPNGADDIRRLAEHVRSLGMRFGLWHLVQLAAPGSTAHELVPRLYRETATPESIADNMGDFGTIAQRTDSYDGGFRGLLLALEQPEGVAFALELFEQWIADWGIEWMRFECAVEDGLAYHHGYNQLLDELRRRHPDFYIEICQCGGQRLDINSVRRTHGSWLSDHTADPDVARFQQTGALRFWPSHMLNMAVQSIRGEGDRAATMHQVLSRMVGVLSFNGDIAQWSAPAVSRVRELVATYKVIRPLLDGEVHFPLPQPRSVDDWDAVRYTDPRTGDGLLFAFRVAGAPTVRLSLTDSRARAPELLVGPASASIEIAGGDALVTVPAHSGALWLLPPPVG